MSDLKYIEKKILAFRNARRWKQFHNPKDSALSLVLEAVEVLEHFQWKDEAALKLYLKKHKKDLAEELADVLYWVVLMAHDLGIDLIETFDRKMKKNEAHYPVHKSRGVTKKYTQF